MRKIATIAAIAALVFASLSVLSPPIATAVVPPATGNNAVITVKVGSDRSGTSGVTDLAGVTLGFYDTATGGTPAFTCVSDADGDCSITVPNTQSNGANRNRRFFVKQISAPAGYYLNSNLAVGTTVASTAYTFETGNQLHNSTTYSSQTDFMIDTGNGNNIASGGIWQDSRNNPVLPPQCGLRVAIVADLSNSVTASDLVALKGAARTFVNSLTGTPSTVSLFTFGTNSPAAGAANVNRPGLLPVSTAAGAATVNGFINGWALPGGAAGGTNWDQAFAAVAQETQHYDLVTVITDGNPTYYGNPTQGPGSRTRFREVENGIFSANAVKAENTRMVAVGVGAGIGGAPDNLRAISGPTINSDYYQTSDYAAAGDALRALALGNCTGTVTVVKQVLPPGTPANSQAGAQPAGGWTFGATATSGVTVNPTTGQTANGTGALNFNLTFPGGTTTAPVTLTETQQPGYTLHPVGGANAVCTRVDTGASLTVTNVGTGFSVPAASTYPVSCTVYNTAPQPPASVVVTKQWVVDGVTFAQGEQPPELSANLTLNGSAQNWGTPRTGFSAGDAVSINETSAVASTSLCTITDRRLTSANGATVNLALPSSQSLAAGTNSYQITNTATCPARLTLLKNVVNGDAAASAWTLTATAPSGALTGPTGTTGATATVTPLATYPLSESAGDTRYVQLTAPGAVAIPGSTISWFCSQVDPTTGAVIPGFSDGLNGGVTIPRGVAVQCEARNQTSALTLIKNVVNNNGGTAVPGDWSLTATPTGPPTPPAGLTAQTVPGSTAGQTIYVRPGQPYVLTETSVPGYSLDSISCVIGDDPTPRTLTTVTLAVGQFGTCTYTNNDQPAHLTLVKTVTNDNGGAATPTQWTLSAAGPTPISGATGDASVTNAAVSAGTYTLSESGGPAGYTAGAWSCTAGTLTGSSLVLPLNTSATCTINNDDQPAHLTLIKTVTNDHGGTAVPTAWKLTATGPTTITGATGSGAVTNAQVNAGTYTLSESGGPAGYTAGTWSCSAGTLTGSSLVLPLNTSATCTLNNNDQPAHLTLEKIVDPAQSGSGKMPSDWTLTAAPDDIVGQGTVSGNGDPTSSGGVHSVAVFAGSYDLSESGPRGFDPGNWSCTGGTQDGAHVSIPSGGDVTCTITNTAVAPKLTLVKEVVHAGTGATESATAWTLTADGPTHISGATGESDVTGAAAKVGTYTLSEDGPDGYTASDWTCEGATSSTGSSVTLAEGDSATCTITNTAIAPKLTLVKVVHNGDTGSTASPGDWTLTAVNGASTITGTSGSGSVTGATAIVGTYDLSESGPDGYTASAWDCDDAPHTDTTVTLSPGDTATCTITNTAIAPELTLVKKVDNGHTGATTTATAWTLTATGPSTITGKSGTPAVTGAAAIAGTYTLTESGGPDGYTSSDWICTGGSATTATTVTLATADTATCTITNTAIAPTLTLIKTVHNDNTGATHTAKDWTLTATGPSTIKGATGTADVTKAAVKVGSYRLDESGPIGYHASTWACTGGAATTATTVTVATGQDATCRLTNTAIDSKLTLVKRVQNLHGGTRTASDWTLYASGPAKLSGKTGAAAVTSVAVPMGAYHLDEGGPTGYTASAWSCTGASVSGATVQIGLQETVICTIVNTDTTAAPPPNTPPLATTGGAVLSWIKTGLLLLLVGGALTVIGRRTRRS